MNVLALDLSLTATGVALPDGSTEALTTYLRGVERLEMLRQAVLKRCWVDETDDACDGWYVDLVVIEGYAYAKTNKAHDVGELGGVIRLALHENGLPFVVVAPASLKKYALGKGAGKGTDKDAMGIAAMRRAGLDFSGRPDECDAWWLRAMALDHYGCPVVQMPAAHRVALDAVGWPVLGSRRAEREQ